MDKEFRQLRKKQFQDFLKITEEKKEKSTMKDMKEKSKKLTEKSNKKETAAKKRGKFLTNNFLKAYSPDSSVIWHSLFMPTEIFRAMDMVPFCSEMASAGLAGAGISRFLVESGESHTQCMDSCSFNTCSMGAVVENVFPIPDFIVTTSQICDTAKKFARLASSHYGRKEFFIDVPYGGLRMDRESYKDAVAYVAEQLQHMVDFFERESDAKLNFDKLKQTLVNSNEAREWFLKCCELRKYGAPLADGVQMIDFSTTLLNIWGTEGAIDVFKTLHEEMSEAVQKGGVFKGKYRIAWIHLRPYYDNTIIKYLEEECGAYMVFEASNYIYWDEFDPDDPFRSLARKMLANSAYNPMDVHFEIYKKIFKDLDVDGAVGFTHKGCRHFYSAIHMDAEHLKDVAPWLVIDGDCIDPRAYSFPLIKTRVDSFIDMLEMREK